MDIKLKNNVVFTAYYDNNLLKERILQFIFEAKTDKIIFKGNPEDINYKTLKKILPLDEIRFDSSSNSINKFIQIDSTDIREIYTNFLNKVNCEYCLIYKI
jgi:hypothetical protein